MEISRGNSFRRDELMVKAMRHRAEKNRMIFALASAIVWTAATAFVLSYALKFSPYWSGGLAIAVGVGTYISLNRPTAKR